jgi:hypothetical protein
VIGYVSYNDIAVPIHCDSAGFVELSNGPLSVSMAPFSSARQSGHMALWCDFADTMVACVSHDDVAVPVHCDSNGLVELSDGPLSVAMALRASARKSGHIALWCDFADTVVAHVSHDDVPVRIHCD